MGEGRRWGPLIHVFQGLVYTLQTTPDVDMGLRQHFHCHFACLRLRSSMIVHLGVHFARRIF